MPEFTEEIGDPARVTPLSARGENASSPSRCLCGAPITQPAGGGKRYACSPPCQRRRDLLQRKVKRVRAALDLWRAERRMGRYSQAQIRKEIAVLKEDLDALQRELQGDQQ